MHFFSLFLRRSRCMYIQCIRRATVTLNPTFFFCYFSAFPIFHGQYSCCQLRIALATQPPALLVSDNWQIHILPTHRTYLLHSYTYNILYPNEKSKNTSSTNIISQRIVYSETARRPVTALVKSVAKSTRLHSIDFRFASCNSYY